MLFNSVHFLVFLPVVTLLYYIIPQKARWVWLLLTSYYFYMSWNPQYALLIAVSTCITFLSGLFIEKATHVENPIQQCRYKKACVAASFVLNLSILFFFKYFNFTLQNINALLAAANVEVIQPKLDLLLPVGISFYTFQALSYTVDVYRGEVPVEKNLGKYALFVSFFPQLVAGPIERSKNLLSQVHQQHRFKFENISDGLLVILMGFCKKIVIADRIADIINPILDNFGDYSGLTIALSIFLFAIQIYCDFSGYSDIAIGSAKMLGFQLMENFEQPYLATSIRDFWRRWHVSLSTWLRDYLYIPLGGSRCSKIKKYRNIMITFLVSGLWHGASWNFVVWGGLHGLYQVVGDGFRSIKGSVNTSPAKQKHSRLVSIIQVFFTFILVCFAWIFFRASSLSGAIDMIDRIVSYSTLSDMFHPSLYIIGAPDELLILFVGILCLFILDLLKRRNVDLLLQKNKLPLLIRCSFYYLLVFVLLRFAVFVSGSQFIYFQF